MHKNAVPAVQYLHLLPLVPIVSALFGMKNLFALFDGAMPLLAQTPDQ